MTTQDYHLISAEIDHEEEYHGAIQDLPSVMRRLDRALGLVDGDKVIVRAGTLKAIHALMKAWVV